MALRFNAGGSNTSEALLKSLFQNDYEKALEIINAGIDVNLLILCESNSLRKFHQTNLETPLYQSPLHIALSQLNLSAVQFLLNQGADPNILNSDQASPLEILMAAVQAHLLDMKSKKEKMAGRKRVPITFNQSDIDKIDSIVEALLCFGLEPSQIVWTKPFLLMIEKMKNWHEAESKYQTSHQELLAHMSMIPEFSSLKQNKTNWFGRTFEKLQVKIDHWRLDRDFKADHSEIDQLHFKETSNWINSIENMPNSIISSYAEIQKDNQLLFTRTLNDAGEAFANRMPVALIRIILEYGNFNLDYRRETFRTRILSLNTSHFWQRKFEDSFDLERFKNIQRCIFALKFLKGIFDKTIKREEGLTSEQLIENIAEYAVDSSAEFSKMLIST